MLALNTMRIFAAKMLSPGLCAAFLIPFSFAAISLPAREHSIFYAAPFLDSTPHFTGRLLVKTC
jgi:hypothetical protein